MRSQNQCNSWGFYPAVPEEQLNQPPASSAHWRTAAIGVWNDVKGNSLDSVWRIYLQPCMIFLGHRSRRVPVLPSHRGEQFKEIIHRIRYEMSLVSAPVFTAVTSPLSACAFKVEAYPCIQRPGCRKFRWWWTPMGDTPAWAVCRHRRRSRRN